MVVHVCVCDGMVHMHIHENQKTALGATLRNTIYFFWDKVLHWPGAHSLSWTSCQARSRNPPQTGITVYATLASFLWCLWIKVWSLCFKYKHSSDQVIFEGWKAELMDLSEHELALFLGIQWMQYGRDDRLLCSKLGYRTTIASVLGVVTAIIDWQFGRM